MIIACLVVPVVTLFRVMGVIEAAKYGIPSSRALELCPNITTTTTTTTDCGLDCEMTTQWTTVAPPAVPHS